jgi:hypothetical protein
LTSNPLTKESEIITERKESLPVSPPQDPRVPGFMAKLEPYYDLAFNTSNLQTNKRIFGVGGYNVIGWEKIEEREGNTVYFYDDSDNKCFYVRAEGVLKLSPETVK